MQTPGDTSEWKESHPTLIHGLTKSTGSSPSLTWDEMESLFVRFQLTVVVFFQGRSDLLFVLKAQCTCFLRFHLSLQSNT